MSDEEPHANGLADSPIDDGTPDLDHNEGKQSDDDEDLFGDDDDRLEDEDDHKRTLDDPDLDSGDDLDRDDRVAATVEDEDQEYDAPVLQTIDADIPRVNYPEGDEFYLLNLPPFLGLKQENFDMNKFEPQKLPHDGDPNRQTSAYSTAMSSIFWRRDPLNPEKLQSNARIVRWSDGSLTLQLATKPQEQFRIATTAMRQDFGKKLPPNTPYDPSKDSLTFLAAAHSTPGIDLQLVRSIDAAMKILPSGGEAHDSVKRLQQSLAALKEDHDPLARLKEVKEDPELAKKAAEQFEKERQRAQRKRENAEDRLITRRDRVLGRAGLGGRSGGAGLSVAGLEDEMGMPVSRGKKKQRRRTNRYGEIYSDDEDDTMPRGRTREDEYDREDDFLAASDEELETYEDGDGEEELLDDDDDPDRDDLEIEGRETVVESRTRRDDRDKKRRETTPKRMRMDEIEGEDDDAEGEPDDEFLQRQSSPGQARKKRRVIEDEDED